MSQNSIGVYGHSVPTGTAHSKLLTLTKAVPSPSTPADFGMVVSAVAGSTSPALNNWAATLSGGDGLLIPMHERRDMVSLAFMLGLYSAGWSNPNNATTDVALWLVKELEGANGVIEYISEYLGKVSLRAGDTAAGGSKCIPGMTGGPKFADTITVLEDVSLSPSMRVTGQPGTPADQISFLQFDAKGAVAVIATPDNPSDPTVYLGVLNAQV